MQDVWAQSREELAGLFEAWGEPAYRVGQLLSWLYLRRAVSWDSMTDLPEPLRRRLAGHFSLGSLRRVRHQRSRDGTLKLLWQLRDGARVESVLMNANPAGFGEASGRKTLCVSTQVGCAYGCRFCASGLLGWKRNLSADEIVGQVIEVERWHGDRPVRDKGKGGVAGSRLVDNLVVMGMGEPLANYLPLMKALRILNAPWGAGIGARHITVSTSGLVPEIRRLAAEPFQFRLAISLHGATDAVRSRLMPINRRYPLAALGAACQDYVEKKGCVITLEYILIEEVNDALDQIKPLAELARRLRAKVNLIPYNRVEGMAWVRPSAVRQRRFREGLEHRGVTVTLRREKGDDIDAACGQLRLRSQTERVGG